MIQRKQTLYLILVIASFVALFFMKLASSVGIDGDGAKQLYDIMIMDYYPLLVLASLVVIMSVITILSFKKAVLQLRMAVVTMILTGGFIIVETYTLYHFMQIESTAEKGLAVAAFFPLVAVCAAFMAFKGISRDIFITRSYNRMR